MAAFLILFAAALVAWLYTRWLRKIGAADAQYLMEYGLPFIVPYVAIVFGTLLALAVWS